MLPAYIIEELRRREIARREQAAPRPTLDLPIPLGPRCPSPKEDEPSSPNRGVVIIDVMA